MKIASKDMLKVDAVTSSNKINIMALLALLMFLVLHFSSTGIGRGGDDEGSGIGGTGRMASPTGESGFGGTGFRPFVGVNQIDEIEILQVPAQRELGVAASLDLNIADEIPVTDRPLVSDIEVVNDAELTRDSSAIDIREEIQRSIDSNAIHFQRQLRDSSAGAVASTSAVVVIDTAAAESAAIPEPVAMPQIDTIDSVEIATASAEPAATSTDPASETLTWDRVASFLSQQAPSSELSSSQLAATEEADVDRLDRPDRIQRPVLPPVQRIRPIQRAGILPPRIKPLRL